MPRADTQMALNSTNASQPATTQATAGPTFGTRRPKCQGRGRAVIRAKSRALPMSARSCTAVAATSTPLGGLSRLAPAAAATVPIRT